MKISSKKILGFTAGAAALLLAAVTWAFYNQILATDNRLGTGSYGARTIERFTPDQRLEPGMTVEKAVGVENTGTYPIVVRMKLDETWERSSVVFKSIHHDGPIDTVVYQSTPKPQWIAVQVDDEDGEVPDTAAEETVIYKELNQGSDWIKGSDGYYYYMRQLEPGSKTASNLLESITLASNADIGLYQSQMFYSVVPVSVIEGKRAAGTLTEGDYNWTTTEPADTGTITWQKAENKLVDGKYGYANADYTLTITTEICQATKEAVSSEWSMLASDLTGIKNTWDLPSNHA